MTIMCIYKRLVSSGHDYEANPYFGLQHTLHSSSISPFSTMNFPLRRSRLSFFAELQTSRQNESHTKAR